MGSVLIVEKSPCSLLLAAACGKTSVRDVGAKETYRPLGDETARFPSADSLRSGAPHDVGIPLRCPQERPMRYALGEDTPER
jgi:hypothetical protein